MVPKISEDLYLPSSLSAVSVIFCTLLLPMSCCDPVLCCAVLYFVVFVLTYDRGVCVSCVAVQALT